MSSQQHPLSNAYLNLCYQADASRIKRRLYRLNKEVDSDKKRTNLEKLELQAVEAFEKVEKRRQARPDNR